MAGTLVHTPVSEATSWDVSAAGIAVAGVTGLYMTRRKRRRRQGDDLTDKAFASDDLFSNIVSHSENGSIGSRVGVSAVPAERLDDHFDEPAIDESPGVCQDHKEQIVMDGREGMKHVPLDMPSSGVGSPARSADCATRMRSTQRESFRRGVIRAACIALLALGALLAFHGRNASRTDVRAIEQMRVGDRVLGANPQATSADRDVPTPDPEAWRIVRLRMKKEDGGDLEITLLRPLAWLEEVEARAGGTIWLNQPEMGAEGPAEVLAISRCPKIDDGDAPLVTGTYRHDASNIVEVHVEGLSEPLVCTENHPFWSETRQDFVAARELSRGEQVNMLSSGPARVLDVTPLPGRQTVYNIEVQGEHVYRVGTAGLLVHNQSSIGTPSAPQRTVIERLTDLENLAPGENTLLKHLPNRGSPRANWRQNASVLRREIRKGNPIWDASVNPDGRLRPYPGSFLEAERNLLREQGWWFDCSTGYWRPPR